MNVTRSLILAALLPLLQGQSPAVGATVVTQPDGRVTLTIRNLAASPLTAYYFKRAGWGVLPDGGRGFRVLETDYKDAALDPFMRPVPTNQQTTQSLLNGDVTFLAALWGDGTSFGPPQSVARLRERRAAAQWHNDNAISVLQRP